MTRLCSSPKTQVSQASLDTELSSTKSLQDLSLPSPTSACSSFSDRLVCQLQQLKHADVEALALDRPFEFFNCGLDEPIVVSMVDVWVLIGSQTIHFCLTPEAPVSLLKLLLAQRGFNPELFAAFRLGDTVLDNYRPLHSYDILQHRALVAVPSSISPAYAIEMVCVFSHECDRFEPVVSDCLGGFLAGHVPELVSEGSGGCYFIRGADGSNVAVFKPVDEEPFAPNNPRNIRGNMQQAGMRQGISSGEAASREFAAFLLDHDGFAGVPATVLVVLRHPAFSTPKLGSLQLFQPHTAAAADVSPSCFKPDEVHKIGLLDVRLLNCDRNDGNILVRQDASDLDNLLLHPIDHGYCFPRLPDVAWCDWCWVDWIQSKIPFSCCTKKYIAGLDAERDIQLLQARIGLSDESARLMRLTYALVQKGVASSLTLFDLAGIAARDDLDSPSTLEVISRDASPSRMLDQMEHVVVDLVSTKPALSIDEIIERRQSFAPASFRSPCVSLCSSVSSNAQYLLDGTVAVLRSAPPSPAARLDRQASSCSGEGDVDVFDFTM